MLATPKIPDPYERRKKMGKKVTRTVPVTEVECLLCDTKEEGMVTMALPLHGTFKTDKALEKAVRKELEDGPYVLLKIKSVSTYNAKYSMSTQDFIAHAERI